MSQEKERKFKALFVINTMTYFTSLISVGKYLKQSDVFEPVFFFCSNYPTLLKDIKTSQELNIKYEISSGVRFENFDIANKKINFISICIRVIRKILLKSVFYKAYDYYKSFYKKEIKDINNIFEKIEPSILILAGDNAGYNTALFIKIGHLKNIPSVVIPSWMAGPKEAAEAHCNNPENQLKSISNKIVGMLFPEWIYEHKGRMLIRWPSYKIILMKLFKVEPPLPWVLLSGYADRILIESSEMQEYCLREGIGKKQLRLTGSIANDEIAEIYKNRASKRNDLYSKYNLDNNKPLLLCAMPPDLLYSGKKPQCLFNSYDDLTEYWQRSLSEITAYNVIISLHPSTAKNDLYNIAKFNLRVIDESISEIIPLVDLFVASVSSTIQWAIMCGIPVLNFDVYRFHYTDYMHVDGVLYCEELEHYEQLLSKLISDQKFYNNVKADQLNFSSRWGFMDRKSGKRIVNNLIELIDIANE